MNGVFHRILRGLREKRRVSQRQVASDLDISQALLSHYENGIREPGLDFVNRACDYYGVTADFLLGRNGEGAVADALSFDTHTLFALLQTVAALGHEELSSGVSQCLSAISYRLVHHMTALDPHLDVSVLAVPENRAAPVSDLAFHQGEMRFLGALEYILAQEEVPDTPAHLETLLTALDQRLARHMSSPAVNLN